MKDLTTRNKMNEYPRYINKVARFYFMLTIVTQKKLVWSRASDLHNLHCNIQYECFLHQDYSVDLLEIDPTYRFVVKICINKNNKKKIVN